MIQDHLTREFYSVLGLHPFIRCWGCQYYTENTCQNGKTTIYTVSDPRNSVCREFMYNTELSKYLTYTKFTEIQPLKYPRDYHKNEKVEEVAGKVSRYDV